MFLLFSGGNQGIRAVLETRHRVQNSVHFVFDDMSRGDPGAAQQIPHETQGPKALLPDDGGGRPPGR